VKRRFAEIPGLCGLFFLLAASLFFFLPVPATHAGGAEILILHTNNVSGYLFPCPT